MPSNHLSNTDERMFQPISAFIAWRYSRAGKHNSFVAFINRFSVAGIALGLMALIVVVSVMNGLQGQLKSRVLGLLPHIVVSHSDAVQPDQLAALPGVDKIMPFTETEGVLQSRKALRGVQVQGIVPAAMRDSVLDEHLQNGRLSLLEPDSFNVIISQSLRQQLQVNVGDTLRVLVAGASVYTPFGRLPSQKLVTIVGVHQVGSRIDDSIIFMHREDVARLLRQRADAPADSRLFLTDAFNYRDTVARLDEMGLSSTNWRARQGTLFDAVQMEGNMMFLMLALIIAVAAFNIVSALVMVVSEKQGDIAILQTQGLSPAGIMMIFMLNGVFNGVRGAAIGLVLGLLLALQMNNIIELSGIQLALSADGNGIPVDVRWSQVLFCTLFSLSLCFLASLYPAYRAMQTTPAAALQND